MKPKGKGTYPFVLLCYGRNSNAGKIAGVNKREYPEEFLPDLLMESGIGVFVVDYRFSSGISAESLMGRDELNLRYLALSLLDTSPMALAASNIGGIMRWLRKQDWVSKEYCPGIFGRSLGGLIAPFAALAYGKETHTALSSCLGFYENMFGQYYSAGGGHTIPGILRYGEFPDVVSALYPCNLHIQHGRNDPFQPPADFLSALKTVKEVYRKGKKCAVLESFETDAGHGSDIQLVHSFFLNCLKREEKL
jgi:hypothetical protein